jgi:anti-sigma factor RsiW
MGLDAMDRMTRIDDVMLMAYVDGEVDPRTAREIETAIAADQEIGRRVAMFRQTGTLARGAYGDVLHEPVPDRLTRLFAAPPAAEPLPALAPRPPRIPRDDRLWRHAGWAVAASLAAIALFQSGFQDSLLRNTRPGPETVVVLGDTERWLDTLSAWYRVHRASFEKDQRLLVDIGAENIPELERWVGGKLQRHIVVPDLSAHGYRQQGGRLLLIGRRPAAQFFYAGAAGDLLQVIISFTDQPDSPGRLDRRDEINVVSWRDKGYAYAFIGLADPARLWRMADETWVDLKPA